ncbi:cytosine permease [Mycolicibacterium baixiangningiae]|uniref:cytosine permease n=1 Tax=Mycolicibacterium baixiangningiae TaxID=2761578 RepID=UPI0018D00C0A|nr:cytosine permease [Mycolicibacterium baixiangningiae]
MTEKGAATDTAGADFHEHALMGRIPVLASGRVYTRWYTWLLQSFLYGAATWSLLSGGYIGSILPPLQGFAAFILGQTAAMLILALFTGVVSSRYGIDTADTARPALGLRGAQAVRWLVFFVMMATVVILVSLMAAAAGQFAEQTLGMSSGAFVGGVCALVALGFCVVLATIGPSILERVANWIIAPLFLLLLGALAAALISRYGFTELWQLRPDPATTPAGAYIRAVEFGIGTAFGYWVTTGALYRLVSTPRLAIHGSVSAWAYLILPITAVGVFAALAVGSADPTTWMYELMGPVGGAVAILFIFIANITALVVMLYVAAVSVRQSKSLMQVPSWLTMVVLAIPAVIATFFAHEVLANYASIVAYIALATGPLVAVLTVDFFILRRSQLDIRHIFTSKPGTKYWFWGGVNPAALIAIAVGIASYLAIYDPVSGESHVVFEYLTASAPAFVISAVVYWVLMVAWVIPSGRGGYPSAKSPRHVEVATNEIGF